MGNGLSICGSSKRKQERRAAATDIQAFWRGCRVRRLFKAYRALGAAIQASPQFSISEGQARRLAQVAGRQLMIAYQQPARKAHQFRGQGEGSGIQGLEGYWIESPASYGKGHLQLITDQLLGEGSYKEVYLSETYQVDFRLSVGLEVSRRATVLARMKDEESTYTLQKGLGILRDRLGQKKVQGELRLAGVYYLRKDPAQSACVEGEELLFEGNLGAGAATRVEKGGLSFGERLQILADVAQTLSVFHAHRIVHGDAKPANFLYKTDDGVKRGYLSDHDLVSDICNTHRRALYAYWGRLARIGLLTPLTDVYAIAVSIGECFWGAAFNPFKENPELVLSKDWDVTLEQSLLGDARQGSCLQELHSLLREVFLAEKEIGQFLLGEEGADIRQKLGDRKVPSQEKWRLMDEIFERFLGMSNPLQRLQEICADYNQSS